MLPHSIQFILVLLRSSMWKNWVISDRVAPLTSHSPFQLLFFLKILTFLCNHWPLCLLELDTHTVLYSVPSLCSDWTFPLHSLTVPFTPSFLNLFPLLSVLQLTLLISFPTCIAIPQTCFHITFRPSFMKGGSFAESDRPLLVTDVIRSLIGPVVV